MVQEELCRLKRLFRQMYEFEGTLQKKWALSLNEAMVLCTLSHGRRNAGELAAEIGLSESRMSRVLGSLERKGALLREIATEDKRVMLFSLTAAGDDKIRAVHAEGIPFDFCDTNQ